MVSVETKELQTKLNNIKRKTDIQFIVMFGILFAGFLPLYGMVFTIEAQQGEDNTTNSTQPGENGEPTTPPDPVDPIENKDRIDQTQQILTIVLVITEAVIGLAIMMIRKYKLGGEAAAQTALTGTQKLLEFMNDYGTVVRVLDKLNDGKISAELQDRGVLIDQIEGRVQVGKEQFDILKGVITKYLGEGADPNTMTELPRESTSVRSRLFPVAKARKNSS